MFLFVLLFESNIKNTCFPFSGDGDNMPPQKKIKITVGERETSVSSTVNNAEKESATTGKILLSIGTRRVFDLEICILVIGQ